MKFNIFKALRSLSTARELIKSLAQRHRRNSCERSRFPRLVCLSQPMDSAKILTFRLTLTLNIAESTLQALVGKVT